MKGYLWVIVGGIAVLLLAGLLVYLSVSLKGEDERALYERVQLELKDEDPQVGLAELKHYLSIYPDSSKVRMQLAGFYAERLNMPLEAVYHYGQIQELDPNFSDMNELLRWKIAAKRRYLAELALEYPEEIERAITDDNVQLRNELRELRMKLYESEAQAATLNEDMAKLKSQNSEYEKILQGSGVMPVALVTPEVKVEDVPVAPPEPQVVIESPKVEEVQVSGVENVRVTAQQKDFYYTVKSGDTLGKIAQAHYGSASYANEIYKLNRDKMSSPNSITVGMTLLLPAGNRQEETKSSAMFKPLTEEQLQRLRGDKQAEAEVESESKPVTPYLYN